MASTKTPHSDRLDRERRRRAKIAVGHAKRVQPPRLEPWKPKRPGEDIEIAVSPGLTVNTPEAIAKMRKQSHDGLIGLLGRRRRSAIWWTQHEGREDCLSILRKIYDSDDGDPEKWAMVVRYYLPFLNQYPDTCVLIIATCEATR